MNECNEHTLAGQYDKFVTLCPYSANPMNIFTTILPQIPINDLNLIHNMIYNYNHSQKNIIPDTEDPVQTPTSASSFPSTTSTTSCITSPSFIKQYNCYYIFNAPYGGDEADDTGIDSTISSTTSHQTNCLSSHRSQSLTSKSTSFINDININTPNNNGCLSTPSTPLTNLPNTAFNFGSYTSPPHTTGSMSNIDTSSSIISTPTTQSSKSSKTTKTTKPTPGNDVYSSCAEKPSYNVQSHLPMEPNKGLIEYKLIFSPSHINRLDQLVTQLIFRIHQGNGIAIYALGVDDFGTVRPSSCASLHPSHANLFSDIYALNHIFRQNLSQFTTQNSSNENHSTAPTTLSPSILHTPSSPNSASNSIALIQQQYQALQDNIAKFNSVTQSIATVSMIYMYYLVLQLNLNIIKQQNLITPAHHNHADEISSASYDSTSFPTTSLEQPYYYTLHFEYILPYSVDINALMGFDKTKTIRSISTTSTRSISTPSTTSSQLMTKHSFGTSSSRISSISIGHASDTFVINPTATAAITSKDTPLIDTKSASQDVEKQHIEDLYPLPTLYTFLIICKIKKELIPHSHLTYYNYTPSNYVTGESNSMRIMGNQNFGCFKLKYFSRVTNSAAIDLASIDFAPTRIGIESNSNYHPNIIPSAQLLPTIIVNQTTLNSARSQQFSASTSSTYSISSKTSTNTTNMTSIIPLDSTSTPSNQSNTATYTNRDSNNQNNSMIQHSNMISFTNGSCGSGTGMFSFMNDRGGNGMSTHDQKNITLWLQWYFSLYSLCVSEKSVHSNQQDILQQKYNLSNNTQNSINNKKKYQGSKQMSKNSTSNTTISLIHDDSDDLSPLSTPLKSGNVIIGSLPRTNSIQSMTLSTSHYNISTLSTAPLLPLSSQTPEFSRFAPQNEHIHETDYFSLSSKNANNGFFNTTNPSPLSINPEEVLYNADFDGSVSEADSFFNDIVAANCDDDDLDDGFFAALCSDE